MDESTKVYRAWKTVLEMLKDRHYIINDADLETTLDQFKERVVEGSHIEFVR